jgi:hypothetical protein
LKLTDIAAERARARGRRELVEHVLRRNSVVVFLPLNSGNSSRLR